MERVAIWQKGVVFFSLLPLNLACGPTSASGEGMSTFAVEAQAVNASWQMVSNLPPAHPTVRNLVLLTDGRVLFSDGLGGDPQHWFTLTRDEFGSYANGRIDSMNDAPFTTDANPSWILNDGRYMICSGEHNDVATYRDCTIYDPIANLWSDIFYTDADDRVGDTPSATLPDGRPLFMTYGLELHGNIYDPASGQWTETSDAAFRVSSNEGASLLLPDGSFLTGATSFRRYVLSTDSWVDTAPTPNQPAQAPGEYENASSEIGPLLLLHDGRAMILGGNTKNGIFTPPTTQNGAGSWVEAAETPNGLNHGDSPACVETTGNVLAIANADPQGFGGEHPSTLWEYQVSGAQVDQWVPVPDPDGPFNTNSDDLRMLALPTGEVLVTGHPDNQFWLYTPGGTIDLGSSPAPSALTPWFGQFRVDGRGLNGTSTGADFGDDSKMATNFPTVFVVNNGGGAPTTRIYPRTYGFDSRVPAVNHVGYFYFGEPNTLPPGNYRAWVDVNGIDAPSGLDFTIPIVDTGIAIMRAALWGG